KVYTLSKNEDSQIKYFDAVIVGSGPVGCTFARKLIEAGYKVGMVEAGASESNPPGSHLKNAFRFQKDINSFSNLVNSHLHLLSVPTSIDIYPDTIDQTSILKTGTIHLNQNPDQDHRLNLRAAAATYSVGGMGTHWTCATPRLRESERFSNLIPDEEMDELYEEAENYLHISKDPYNGTMLQTTILKALKKRYGEDIPQALPLAVRFKKADKPDALSFNFWTGPYDILRKENYENENFTLMGQHLAQFLHPKINNTSIIDGLITKNLLKHDKNKNFNWDIEIPALGKYLCEQTVAYCQIVLNKKIVKEMLEDPTWSEGVKKHKEAYPKDPIPIPFDVPLPQCWIPYTDKRPWHAQVHRDAFSYGQTPANVDNRVILDFRYFAASNNSEELNNRVEFSKEIKDMFGMPQPTFYVRTSEKDAKTNHKMLNDMIQTALSMGGFLPGNEPQFMPPGTALHITGTVRMGINKETSVVDTNLCVHGFRNLYLGTTGVIPTTITANPTLTSIALAIKSANHIIKKLKE
ncbi:21562_t:CDS:2, partial [Dentiscutata erythropus]